MLHRLGLWYWRFIQADRCLCRVGLGRVCFWLEDKANQ